MTHTGPLAYAFGRVETDGLRRVMGWSLAIHAGAVLVLFAIPRDWLRDRPAVPLAMTISLGASGPKTTGLNPAGARPVEQVAPPPQKPETARPSAPRTEAPVATVKTSKPPPKPAAETTAPTVTPPRAPTTGAQVTPGTARPRRARPDRARGSRAAAARAASRLKSPQTFAARSTSKRCSGASPRAGRTCSRNAATTILTFTIRRDGTFTAPETVQSASGLLDYHARNSFNGLVLPPLPPEYKEDTLKVRLTFPYVR